MKEPSGVELAITVLKKILTFTTRLTVEPFFMVMVLLAGS